MAHFALAFGTATKNRTGKIIEAFFPAPLINPKAELVNALAKIAGYSEGNQSIDISAAQSGELALAFAAAGETANADFAEKGLETSKLGIINAAKCYHEVEKIGNKNIRTLFASTGVKGDELPSTYYVDNLLYPNSVNTAPLATIEDYLISGQKEPSKIISEIECDAFFVKLEKKGVEIDAVYDSLLKDGLDAFKVSFVELLNKLKS